MSKTWIGLIVIAAVVLLGWTGVQFYNAITGQGDKEFNQTVTMINGELPQDTLGKSYAEKDKVLVFLEDIEGEQ